MNSKNIMLLSMLLSLFFTLCETYGAEQGIMVTTKKIDRRTATCWILGSNKRGAFDGESKALSMHWPKEPDGACDDVLAIEKKGTVKVTISDARENVITSVRIAGVFAYKNPIIEAYGEIRLYTQRQNGDVRQTIFKRTSKGPDQSSF